MLAISSSFRWAVAGALGLHVVLFLAIGAGDLEARREPPAVVKAGMTARVVRVAVVLQVGERSVTTSPPLSRTLAPRREQITATRPASSEPSVSAEARPAESTYFESGTLDQTAEPVGEWTLDTSLLPLTGESRFQVAIWVSTRGEIERWEVKSDTVSDELAAAIFARLDDTVMNPARIGLKPVASVLRFELNAERQ